VLVTAVRAPQGPQLAHGARVVMKASWRVWLETVAWVSARTAINVIERGESACVWLGAWNGAWHARRQELRLE